MTDVLLIRHAIAEDRDKARSEGLSDADRSLTARGHARMELASNGLRRVVDALAVVATSPLIRAVQTARIVATAFGHAPVVEVASLSPDGGILELSDWVASQLGDPIALVGHEPNLGLWASWALADSPRSFVRFKKGGICCLRFDGAPKGGSATLQWSLTPGQLRRIAA